MALEDAATLGACIARQTQTDKALRQYEALRQPRTARVAAASGGLARIYHASGLMKFTRDALLRRTPNRLMLSRLDRLYVWNLRHD
jgi:salicylate hydroxylase